jgi:hypothetical protein
MRILIGIALAGGSRSFRAFSEPADRLIRALP